MRLWSLHPKYLDAKGLVALWREGLLAQAVLRGRTKGYLHHPQLERFREQSSPLIAIANYLRAVHAEALERGYEFDSKKLGRAGKGRAIAVTRGQLRYEWQHLLKKLKQRDPQRLAEIQYSGGPHPHPLFHATDGGVAAWERRPDPRSPKKPPKKKPPQKRPQKRRVTRSKEERKLGR
jgi:hypothetical protein